MNQFNLLKAGMEKAFLDAKCKANPDLVPSLLTNNPKKGQKVFLALEAELQRCQEFCFSVAFITESGLQLFKPVLQYLEQKGIPGRILTTDYLAFSDPKALNTLLDLKNIELRMYCCQKQENPSDSVGFHTKGYFFEEDDQCCMIIGSSNLTDAALCTNEEWNTRLITSRKGSFYTECMNAFESLYTSPQTVLYRDYAREYEEIVRIACASHPFQPVRQGLSHPFDLLPEPNTMQEDFVERLSEMIEEGKTIALLVSATGTGKTYASAFAVRQHQPGRVLFLVHREKIARQAMESFRRVLGDEAYTYGLLSGNSHDVNASCLFSTVQTMSKPGTYMQFGKHAFDWIIVDEVHHAASNTYQTLFEYFRPKFWLGMSATPERTDRNSIYELFDYNVACRITLSDALEQNLLCPFHYYALDDLSVSADYSIDSIDPRDFQKLKEEERVKHILAQARYYGWSGDRVKGLIFVSTIEEAEKFSHALNAQGLQTLALSSRDYSEAERDEAIERLCQDRYDEHALDYLITVGIFNEGVDIPEVNQVLLLRPTQSAIVFTQQLGRGLRKYKGKEFVTVLDFVGQYKENYLIPAALSGDKTGNKDMLRRFVYEGNREIPGISSVHFSPIARSRILQSIDLAHMNSAAKLAEGYFDLRQQLGRIPRLVDFEQAQGMDPMLIFTNPTYRCYPEFTSRMEKDRTLLTQYSDLELGFLQFVSRYWANGKRALELWLLESLVHHQKDWLEHFLAVLDEYGIRLKKETWKNLNRQFEMKWLLPQTRNDLRSKGIVFLERKPSISEEEILIRLVKAASLPLEARQALSRQIEHDFEIAPSFLQALTHPDFYDQLTDLMEFSLLRWKNKYSKTTDGTWFDLYQSYTYADVFRLLDLPVFENAQNVGGYKLFKEQNLLPVFINYQKAEDLAQSLQYEDHFESPSRLIAFSKNRRTLASPEIRSLQSEHPPMVLLFLRKSNDDTTKAFYFLGEMKPDGLFEQTTMANDASVVKIGYRLLTPLREDLYDYFVKS